MRKRRRQIKNHPHTYSVGTFLFTNGKIKAFVSHQTPYNRKHPSCIEYFVKAENGKRAKAIAKEMRRKYEQQRRQQLMESSVQDDEPSSGPGGAHL